MSAVLFMFLAFFGNESITQDVSLLNVYPEIFASGIKLDREQNIHLPVRTKDFWEATSHCSGFKLKSQQTLLWKGFRKPFLLLLLLFFKLPIVWEKAAVIVLLFICVRQPACQGAPGQHVKSESSSRVGGIHFPSGGNACRAVCQY